MRKNIIPDKAELDKKIIPILCDNCTEKYLFHLKNKNGEFSVGLIDILKCLAFAERKGVVPPISEEWWLAVQRHYDGLD